MDRPETYVVKLHWARGMRRAFSPGAFHAHGSLAVGQGWYGVAPAVLDTPRVSVA